MWKVEVIEVRNRSEAKGPNLHLSYGIWRFNPNNDDTTLHKGMSIFPIHPNRGANQYPTPEGRYKAGFVDSFKNHRPASILKVSLSPSPVACEIISPYIHLNQVESTGYNVWEHITSLSTQPLQSWSSTNTGLLGTSVLDRLVL